MSKARQLTGIASALKSLYSGNIIRDPEPLFGARRFANACIKKKSITDIELNNGHKIPVLGLGTWGSPKSEVAQTVMDAINLGYRHIDCAFIHGNEKEVGKGIEAKIHKGVVTREELFITSKLWNTFHRADLVCGAFHRSLKSLKLEYLDLYVMQWPMAYKECGELIPLNVCKKIAFSDVDYVETWLAMEKLVNAGYIRSIGLSNFNKCQIQRILRYATIIPQVVQVECHPYLPQIKLKAFLDSKNIAMTSFSPLGSPSRPNKSPSDPVLLDDTRLINMGRKYRRSPVQLLLRYQIQKCNITIPKAIVKENLEENMDIFDFAIHQPDMKMLDGMNLNFRYISIAPDHPFYPFNDEY